MKAKKLLALVLSLCLIVGLMPVTAMADDTDVVNVDYMVTGGTQDGTLKQNVAIATFKSAMADLIVESGTNYTVDVTVDNVKIPTDLGFAIAKNLDVTIHFPGNGDVTLNNDTIAGKLTLDTKGTLKLTSKAAGDVTVDKDGALTLGGADTTSVTLASATGIVNNGMVTINGAKTATIVTGDVEKITNNGTMNIGSAALTTLTTTTLASEDGIANTGAFTLTVKGTAALGAVAQSASSVAGAAAPSLTITASAGALTLSPDVQAGAMNINISGETSATLATVATTAGAALNINGTGSGAITVGTDTFANEGKVDIEAATSTSAVTVGKNSTALTNAGTLTIKTPGNIQVGGSDAHANSTLANQGTLTIEGGAGTIGIVQAGTTDPAITNTGSISVTGKGTVGKIQNGAGKVVLDFNGNQTEALTINAISATGTQLADSTLDIAGKVTVAGGVAPGKVTSEIHGTVEVTDKGLTTVADSTMKVGGNDGDAITLKGSTASGSAGNLTIGKGVTSQVTGTVFSVAGGTLTINDGATFTGFTTLVNRTGGEVAINGGTFTSDVSSAIFAADATSDKKINIAGGTFTLTGAGAIIIAQANIENVLLQGGTFTLPSAVIPGKGNGATLDSGVGYTITATDATAGTTTYQLGISQPDAKVYGVSATVGGTAATFKGDLSGGKEGADAASASKTPVNVGKLTVTKKQAGTGAAAITLSVDTMYGSDVEVKVASKAPTKSSDYAAVGSASSAPSTETAGIITYSGTVSGVINNGAVVKDSDGNDMKIYFAVTAQNGDDVNYFCMDVEVADGPTAITSIFEMTKGESETHSALTYGTANKFGYLAAPSDGSAADIDGSTAAKPIVYVLSVDDTVKKITTNDIETVGGTVTFAVDNNTTGDFTKSGVEVKETNGYSEAAKDLVAGDNYIGVKVTAKTDDSDVVYYTLVIKVANDVTDITSLTAKGGVAADLGVDVTFGEVDSTGFRKANGAPVKLTEATVAASGTLNLSVTTGKGATVNAYTSESAIADATKLEATKASLTAATPVTASATDGTASVALANFFDASKAITKPYIYLVVTSAKGSTAYYELQVDPSATAPKGTSATITGLDAKVVVDDTTTYTGAFVTKDGTETTLAEAIAAAKDGKAYGTISDLYVKFPYAALAANKDLTVEVTTDGDSSGAVVKGAYGTSTAIDAAADIDEGATLKTKVQTGATLKTYTVDAANLGWDDADADGVCTSGLYLFVQSQDEADLHYYRVNFIIEEGNDEKALTELKINGKAVTIPTEQDGNHDGKEKTIARAIDLGTVTLDYSYDGTRATAYAKTSGSAGGDLFVEYKVSDGAKLYANLMADADAALVKGETDETKEYVQGFLVSGNVATAGTATTPTIYKPLFLGVEAETGGKKCYYQLVIQVNVPDTTAALSEINGTAITAFEGGDGATAAAAKTATVTVTKDTASIALDSIKGTPATARVYAYKADALPAGSTTFDTSKIYTTDIALGGASTVIYLIAVPENNVNFTGTQAVNYATGAVYYKITIEKSDVLEEVTAAATASGSTASVADATGIGAGTETVKVDVSDKKAVTAVTLSDDVAAAVKTAGADTEVEIATKDATVTLPGEAIGDKAATLSVVKDNADSKKQAETLLTAADKTLAVASTVDVDLSGSAVKTSGLTNPITIEMTVTSPVTAVYYITTFPMDETI